MELLRGAAALAVNFIFPPVCAFCEDKLDDTATPLCTPCWNALERDDSTTDAPPDPEDAFSRIRGIYKFNDRFKQLIHFLKYDHKRSIGTRLGGLMWDCAPKDFFQDLAMIVAVPIHHTRRRERGYNQAEIIAEALSRASGIPAEFGILKRVRHTGTQTALTRGERSRNIGRAFRVKGTVTGKRVLLVDDVFTTGATVNECAKALMEARAAEVRVLAAARV
jgi:ComF family protein